VISADGRGIVMHPKGLREATRRAMEREEHNNTYGSVPGRRRAASGWPRWSRSTRSIPIDNNQKRLQYDQALALAYGLPIATGVIEGACRYLVKDRMDITGARWSLGQAKAILKLRSLKVSGDLAAYLAFHFEQKHKPITPDRRSPWPSARRLEMDGMPAPQRDRKTDLNSRIVGRPASFQKSPPVGGALRAANTWQDRGAAGNQDRSGTGVFVPAKREWPARYRRGVVDGLA